MKTGSTCSCCLDEEIEISAGQMGTHGLLVRIGIGPRAGCSDFSCVLSVLWVSLLMDDQGRG